MNCTGIVNNVVYTYMCISHSIDVVVTNNLLCCINKMCRDIFRELVEDCVPLNTSTVAAGGQAYLVVNGLGILH